MKAQFIPAWQSGRAQFRAAWSRQGAPSRTLVYPLLGDTAHAAATVHDFLYATGGVTRAEADGVLREAAISSGVPFWKAWMMWIAVRLFGFTRRNK